MLSNLKVVSCSCSHLARGDAQELLLSRLSPETHRQPRGDLWSQLLKMQIPGIFIQRRDSLETVLKDLTDGRGVGGSPFCFRVFFSGIVGICSFEVPEMVCSAGPPEFCLNERIAILKSLLAS